MTQSESYLSAVHPQSDILLKVLHGVPTGLFCVMGLSIIGSPYFIMDELPC